MNIYDLIFIALICSGAAFLLLYLTGDVVKKAVDKRFGTVDRKKVFSLKAGKIRRILSKNDLIRKVLREIGIRLSYFNSRDMGFNENIGTVCLLGVCLAHLVFTVIILVLMYPLWYLGVVYSFLFAGVIVLSFVGVSEFLSNRFMGHIPDTLRIINSRYSSRGNIVKALAASMDDFHPSVKKEMVRIYDALSKNDMEQIRETFEEIREKHSGEYVMLMLELINHAYYNGGSEVVRDQFDIITEDVIYELENKKDMKTAATGYIIMSVLFILLLPATVLFNNGILGESSAQYYGSLSGMMFVVLFLVAVFILVTVIVLTERSEPK